MQCTGRVRGRGKGEGVQASKQGDKSLGRCHGLLILVTDMCKQWKPGPSLFLAYCKQVGVWPWVWPGVWPGDEARFPV